MNISIGSTVKYSSAAGVITGVVKSINISSTAKPNFSNVFMTIAVTGGKAGKTVTIPADDASLKMFKVEVL